MKIDNAPRSSEKGFYKIYFDLPRRLDSSNTYGFGNINDNRK